MTAIAAVDMFVVATATIRLLYAVIFLNHHRRGVIHSEPVPTGTIQQRFRLGRGFEKGSSGTAFISSWQTAAVRARRHQRYKSRRATIFDLIFTVAHWQNPD
jgi:hypothetical protein